jgi:hypothetical protein
LGKEARRDRLGKMNFSIQCFPTSGRGLKKKRKKKKKR